MNIRLVLLLAVLIAGGRMLLGGFEMAGSAAKAASGPTATATATATPTPLPTPTRPPGWAKVLVNGVMDLIDEAWNGPKPPTPEPTQTLVLPTATVDPKRPAPTATFTQQPTVVLSPTSTVSEGCPVRVITTRDKQKFPTWGAGHEMALMPFWTKAKFLGGDNKVYTHFCYPVTGGLGWATANFQPSGGPAQWPEWKP